MITKVILKNWRSHLNSELIFSSGTNALLGAIGTGKSSILEGICFAFFGTTPILQSKKLKLEELIMKKPIEKDKAEVEVHFQADGKSYSVKRTIEKRKGTTYSEIRENGKLIEAPNASRVTELVEKILKVNYELFSKAIYSEQNALDYFLTIPKGQRMKKIDELLMIDKFEKARTNAVTLINKIAERKLGKQSIVDQVDIELLQKMIFELRKSIAVAFNEKQSLQKILEEVKIERVKLEKEVLELQKIRENLESLKREERGISSAINEISISIEKLETSLKGLDKVTIEQNLNNLTKLTKELESLLAEKQEEYRKLQEQTSRSKAEVEFLRREKIEKLEKELNEKLKIKKEFEKLKSKIGEDAEKQLEEKRLLVEKFIGEIEALKIKIEDLKETIEQLSSVEGKCPVCERKLDEAKRKLLIKKKEEKIVELKEKLEKLREQKTLSEMEIKQLESTIKNLDEMFLAIKDFNELKVELDNSKNVFLVLSESTLKLEKELSSLKVELENLQKKVKEVFDKKQKLEITFIQLHDYEEKKGRINDLIEKKESLLKHISQLEHSISGKEIDKLEFSLRELIRKEQEISSKIFGIEQLLKEKEIRLSDFEKNLSQTMKEKEEIKRLDKLIQELKIFEKALEETQIELRREFVSTVNYTMSNLWQTLYPYQDFVSVRLNIEEGDYVLQLKTRTGDWVNVEGIASGGERSIAALALRIAFALVMAPGLRLLILDEPTMNLDSKSISVLANTLRERIQDYIDQCFIITHQAELEEAVTGAAYRLERDKTQDSVTKVISLV